MRPLSFVANRLTIILTAEDVYEAAISAKDYEAAKREAAPGTGRLGKEDAPTP